jgi:chorismate synthase
VLRFLTAGESHGKALVVIVEGLPAGLQVEADDIASELSRRRLGYGRGPRMRFEADELTLLGGIRHGRTLGSPVAIEIGNSEWPKWTEEMSPAPGATAKPLTQPRPGHADLAGMQKYGLGEARDVLERASARETAARVAAGALCKLLLRQLGTEIVSHVVQMGPVIAKGGLRPGPSDLATVDLSPVRCFDPEPEAEMIEAVKAAARDGDSLGGVAEVIAYGAPPGLGSHVHWDRKIDGLLAQAMMSIHAVKAVEIGEGVEVAGLRGSVAHDPITWDPERARYVRASNHAGGVEGGITTGDPVVVRGFMKPLPTLTKPLRSVDIATHEPAQALRERTDSCTVPAAGVVGEAMVAFVLADAYRRKFGGDHIDDVKQAVAAYERRLGWRR